jgi:hypothetical protein
MKFIPITSIHANPDVMHVSITKTGVMQILNSALHPEVKDMFIQFYMTPENRNILAWTFHETVPLETLREFNKVCFSKQKQYSISCRKALSTIKKLGMSWSKLPVKTSEDKSLLGENKRYYYVELK